MEFTNLIRFFLEGKNAFSQNREPDLEVSPVSIVFPPPPQLIGEETEARKVKLVAVFCTAGMEGPGLLL